jgi:hypothetical protein
MSFPRLGSEIFHLLIRFDVSGLCAFSGQYAGFWVGFRSTDGCFVGSMKAWNGNGSIGSMDWMHCMER